MVGIKVKRLDHVHLLVTNREAAAAWFDRVLGLQIAQEFKAWSSDPAGPLFLSDSNGDHCLALFQSDLLSPQLSDHTIAFKVCAAEFIALVSRLGELQLSATDGSMLSKDDIVDHQLAWSVYFLDPDGNRFELTTYDYEAVSEQLSKF
jgi:catechol 2,3-dioxygenase-like lactoylglutathione lyase family enzyme